MNSTARETREELQQRLDSPLQIVVDDMMKMNSYDYNKMLEELELMEMRDKNKKEKIKIYKELSKKWKERLHNMRESKERMVVDKRQEILDQIRRRNESSSKILDKSKMERVSRLIKMNKTMQTEKSIKGKMDEHFQKLENDRQEIEKMIENKISLYSQNNKDHIENLKQKFSMRISESLENFHLNLKSVKERMDQKLKDDEQKVIEKFEKWYFYLKEQKEKLKEKKLIIQQKRVKNSENLSEKEADNDRRRSELKRKLDNFEIRKREVSEKQRMKIQEIIKKEEENYQKILENKKKFDIEKLNYHDNILRYQSSVITRSDLKESSSELSRLSAYEKVILRQMQLERKLNLFHSEMNKLKDSSVMKKSKQQKRGIFLELKRKEEERKRKEEDEKAKASGQ